MSEYRVWDCKIVVPADAEFPEGFDSPPRTSAMDAIEACGIEIVGCFSGWGGTLSDVERKIIEDNRTPSP